MTQNKEEAIKWYRQAAAQGIAQAQCNLAVAYSKGEGVTQNKEEAVKWYRQAAAQGRKIMYSQEADVWSFGVVIYELFSGDTPYREWRDLEDVKKLVCKAVDPMRLEDRDGPCPYTLYQLQQQCFSSSEKRPSFAQMTGEILDILDKTESNEKQVKIGKFYVPSELGEDPREDDNAEWESKEEAQD